jgi:hypothetical protein
MSVSVTNVQVGTGSGERATRIYVTKLDQRVPYIIANKGALVSNPVDNGVIIDPDTGKMFVQRPYVAANENDAQAYSALHQDAMVFYPEE